MYKGESFPCAIKVDDVRGRYLSAIKNIKPGEIILQEKPLIVGPCGIGIEKSKSFSTCLGCYKNVTTFYKCSKCGWPVCNVQCEMMPDHANYECTVFADCPVSPVTNPPEYEKIKILRCLMLKDKNPERWKLLMSLESRPEIRKQSFYAVSSNHSCYKFITQECHLKQYSFDEIHHIAGVSAINSYGTSGLLGHANSDGHSRYASFLFANASLVSHECLPNTRAVIQQKGKSYIINIIATTEIQRGTPITASYIEHNVGTLERRDYILEHFYFPCQCRRCKDPTEHGSNFSAVKCMNPDCKTGYLLPRNPLVHNSEWSCIENCCDVVTESAWIVNLLLDIKNQIMNCKKIDDYRHILEKYKGKILHRNHYLIINVQCDLIRLIDDYMSKVDDCDRIRYAKLQIDLCRHCLSVADLIQPGSNRYRGTLLYYLQEGLITHCICKLQECSSDNKGLEIIRKSCKKQFAEALEIIKEAKAILITEPIGSADWKKGTLLSQDTPKVKSLMSYLRFKD